MTAIPHPLHSAGHDAANAHGHEHHEIGFVKKYIFSTDHKIIGLQFLFLGLFFFVIGGMEAMLVRWQLGWPGADVPITPPPTCCTPDSSAISSRSLGWLMNRNLSSSFCLTAR